MVSPTVRIETRSVTLLPTGTTYGEADDEGPVTIEVCASALLVMRAAEQRMKVGRMRNLTPRKVHFLRNKTRLRPLAEA